MVGETHKLCRSGFSLDGLTSTFGYTDPIKQAIHRFKYKPFIEKLAPVLAKLMLDDFNKRPGFKFFLKSKPVLVPIPLHWWRKHLRGYNQIELLVKELERQLNLPYADLLIRKKFTKPQSELSFKKRKSNVFGIFEAEEKHRHLPKNIILVDDVWTTGSTLKSAGLVLKRKGVTGVWGLTLAR